MAHGAIFARIDVLKQPIEVFVSMGHAEALRMSLFDFSVRSSSLRIAVLLGKSLPAFGLKRV